MSAGGATRSPDSSSSSLFWIQTLTFGGVLFVSAIFIYAQFLRSGTWQYLALSLIAFAVMGGHISGWSMAWRRGDCRTAIWLIGITHILGSVAAPLFMETYWLIGPFLLLLIPLQVGLVDDLKKVPTAFIYSLLGGAGMLLTDLWAPFERVRLFGEVYGAVELVSIVLLVLFIVHVWVFYQFRLRFDPNDEVRFDLATQLALVFTGLAGITILVVVVVLLLQFRSTQIAQVGERFQMIAQVNAERIGDALHSQIDTLQGLGLQNSVLQEGLESANALHDEKGAAALDAVQELERTWQLLPDINEFVLRFRSNPQAIELSKFRGIDLLHSDMLLVDRLGGLVASQGERPEHYYFGDQVWFQEAWNEGLGGVSIGELQYNEDGIPRVRIAVGVLDPRTNQISGVLASSYSLLGIQREMLNPRATNIGQIALLTASGEVIAASEGDLVGTRAWQNVFEERFLPRLGPRQVFENSDWNMGIDHRSELAVLAYAPLRTSSGVDISELRRLNWLIVVSETQTEALAGVIRSIKVTTLVGVLLMIAIVVAAIQLARLLARPIEALRAAAVAASQGDLDQRAEPVGPIELVALAEAFNSLTAHLQLLINNLQGQVAERTRELEARADELTALNRITSSAASAWDLNSALNVIAKEMVYLFRVKQTAIALLDPSRVWLAVVAEYNRDPNDPSTLEMRFRVADSPASRQVIETSRTLTISQAQIELAGEPIHGLLRRTGTHSLMIVPLLARGEVIGTIDVTCSDDDREFSPREVELAETIAGQIAGAIDNARLFSEMEAAKDSAEAANAAKSNFLANVSHELRTPLTSVMGFARIVEKRLEERIFPQLDQVDERTGRAIQQVEQNLKIIVSEGERLTALINNVLDLSRIEAGKIDWKIQPVQISEVIEHGAAAVSGLLETKQGVDLLLEIPEGLPAIPGDRNRLVQAVINLLSNALKFTDHGRITCRVELLEDAIQVSVADTGSGIAGDDQERVFEKFTQLGDTLTEKPQGSGLGLPITKEIIESHGGRIWLESRPGKGSTFFFTLPLQPGGQVLEQSRLMESRG